MGQAMKELELSHAGAYSSFPDEPEAYRDAAWDKTQKALFETAVIHAEDRISWYDRKAGLFAQRARWLRLTSLGLFALGTLAPIAAPLLERIAAWPSGTNTAVHWPVAEVGYVLLALAGAIVIFDQFFGVSSSWIRFRQSQARLEVLLAEMRFSWAALMVAERAHEDRALCTACITLLREFVVKVELLAEAETKEWAASFRSQIESFDTNPQLRIKGGQPLTGLTSSSDQTAIEGLPGETGDKPPPSSAHLRPRPVTG